jgi:Ca2+-binding RTX toxin-like protein
MTDRAHGGNDIVSGASMSDSHLYGDAQTLSGFSIGGNDTVIAKSVPGLGGNTEMYGDGAELLDHAKGGNDTLISGANNDQMWGDAATVAPTARTGTDNFVFSPPNGQDTINDFERGKDHIDLKAFGFGSFNDVASLIEDTQNGALISFDANDSILVVGVHHEATTDFILA